MLKVINARAKRERKSKRKSKRKRESRQLHAVSFCTDVWATRGLIML